MRSSLIHLLFNNVKTNNYFISCSNSIIGFNIGFRIYNHMIYTNSISVNDLGVCPIRLTNFRIDRIRPLANCTNTNNFNVIEKYKECVKKPSTDCIMYLSIYGVILIKYAPNKYAQFDDGGSIRWVGYMGIDEIEEKCQSCEIVELIGGLRTVTAKNILTKFRMRFVYYEATYIEEAFNAIYKALTSLSSDE